MSFARAARCREARKPLRTPHAPRTPRQAELWWAAQAPDFETVLERAGLTEEQHRRFIEDLSSAPPVSRPRTYAEGRLALYVALKAVCEPEAVRS